LRWVVGMMVRANMRHLPPLARDGLPLALVLAVSAALRLISLNYSHFQGDEISALYPVGVPFPTSVLEQQKGPVQLLATLAVRLLAGRYGEWETRLPFSLASILGVYVVYLMARDAFGRRPALWAAALTGSCGLLVAFGRIVQYQAFVMLAVLLTTRFLLLWVRKDEPHLLYLGLAAFAVGVLSHYDSLTFLPALLLMLALGFRRRELWTRPRVAHLALAGLLAAAMVGAFYVPYVFRPGFTSVTGYLRGRVASGLGWDTFVRTRQLLDLYFPPLYLPAVAGLAAVGAARALGKAARPEGLVIITWFAVPFGFYMLLGGQPRSHVYMYVLPALVLAGLGIDTILSRLKPGLWSLGGQAVMASVLIAFTAICYYMLVDHTVEHPWEKKTIFGYELPNLVRARVQGVFGFPYRRGLDQVGEMFRSGRLLGTFDSNERDSTTAFYFGAPRSSPPLTYFDDPGSVAPDYYFYVLRPFSLRRDLPETVKNTYRRIGSVMEGGRTTIEIYAAPWMAP
ncbi:MAG TPA: glycosyltransferase family 39 protein, partial [Anaerolineales bacterium]|nr:glycosyltransferase family 39 protein [Anaerolineales bacterium]